VFQSLRRTAASRSSHRSVRLVVEELESRNLLSAGSAISPLLFDVPSVAGQASIPDSESVVAPIPIPAATGSSAVVANLDGTDWQRMVESSWSLGSEHAISSELARTVHYAKVDVMDGFAVEPDAAADAGLAPLQDGGSIEVSFDGLGEG
jgi:hypothetical protein